MRAFGTQPCGFTAGAAFALCCQQGGIAERKAMIDREHDLPITKQAKVLRMLSLSAASFSQITRSSARALVSIQCLRQHGDLPVMRRFAPGQPITVVLNLINPIGPDRWPLRHRGQTWLNEAGGTPGRP